MFKINCGMLEEMGSPWATERESFHSLTFEVQTNRQKNT